MNTFTIETNQFLDTNIEAYYHCDYLRFGSEGNPDFINHLKNQFNSYGAGFLQAAERELCTVLKEDLPAIQRRYAPRSLTICVIPRAKTEGSYSQNQKLFRRVIAAAATKLGGFVDGTQYIVRHRDTITTHMHKSGNGGAGRLPYRGITKDTCTISGDVRGKDILLIDDIYTKTINIDEDAIQALLDNGARSVIFYSVAKTVSRF